MAENTICREQIMSEQYRDFIISAYGGRMPPGIPQDQLCVQSMEIGYKIIYLSENISGPLQFGAFPYSAIPQCFTLIDTAAMNQAGIIPVQNYPSLELMGENVMLGFVDTGIDYTNEVFRNLDGTTRLAAIWDQTIQTGTAPQDLFYGSEYREGDINEALGSRQPLDIVPSMDEDGHGTFLASIAAGGADEAQGFIGAAPESTIAVVKLKPAKQYLRDFYFIPENAPCYQENDIMLGVQYLVRLAEERNMPIAICIALGTNMGGHNGTTPIEIVLAIYASMLNRAIIIGVGNEANQRHHFFDRLEDNNARREVEIRVGDGVEGFVTELWTDIPNLLNVSLISPSGEIVPRISVRQGRNAVFRFLFEQTEVSVDYLVLVQGNNSQLVFFRFKNPAPGLWRIVVEPIQIADGQFHMWLPVKEFLTGDVIFLRSNPDTTLTTPSATYPAISVGYYNGAENSIDINSGRGYTRGGMVKPDFVAPGVGVTGAMPGNRFVTETGSSVAAGITAGASALLLEWLNYKEDSGGVDTLQLKNMFILGAQRRPNVAYPSQEWGYGTLNLYRTLDQIRQI